MLIVCPSCATSYDVKPASLQPDGRQVRCVRCRAVWHAEPAEADKPAAAASTLVPEHTGAEVPMGPPVEETVPAAEHPAEPAGETAWIDHAAAPRLADDPSSAASGDGVDLDWDLAPVPDSGDSEAEPSDTLDVQAPPLAPVDLDAGRPPLDVDAAHFAEPVGGGHEDIETLAARRFPRGVKRRRLRWSMSALQTIILALVIIDSILIAWRKDVVRVLPQTASFYALMGFSVNLRGLAFDAVVTGTEEHEGVPILVVEGNIVNATGTSADLPRLKLAVRNAAKQEIYSWTAAPPRPTLSPGQAVAFRTRLASPPPESHDVLVRFVNRRDIVAEPR
jgi:predicted Zn finger-like uncharacterized protein